MATTNPNQPGSAASAMLKAENISYDYEIYRREYIPFQMNPMPNNASWIGKDCPACRGWAPLPLDKPKPDTEVNLTILPLSAVLVFLIGMCVNVVNWFHKDMKIRKHMDILRPAPTNMRWGQRKHSVSSITRSSSTVSFSQGGMDTMLSKLPSNSQPGTNNQKSKSRLKKDPSREDNLFLASSSSTSYASVFSADMQQPGINRISSLKTIPDIPQCRRKERVSRKGSEGHGVRRHPHTPLLGSRKQFNKVQGSHSDDLVPVVMYLDRAKLQKQMQRHLEAQEQAAAPPIAGSYTDLTSRKQSMVSSGYASSASNSRTESQVDISQATSIAELCSDKVNSPIQVLSSALCDHLVIGNLLSKSSFLLHIPTSNSMSPTPLRYSGSPNGFIEDCFIFPGSGSGSLDRSPASADGAQGAQHQSQLIDHARVAVSRDVDHPHVPVSVAFSPADSVISTSNDNIKLHANEHDLSDHPLLPPDHDMFHEENECQVKNTKPNTIPLTLPDSPVLLKNESKDYYQLVHISNGSDELELPLYSPTSPRPFDLPKIHKSSIVKSTSPTSPFHCSPPDVLQLRPNKPKYQTHTLPNGLPPKPPKYPKMPSPTKSILKPTSPPEPGYNKIPSVTKPTTSPGASSTPTKVHSPPRPTTLAPPSLDMSDSSPSPSPSSRPTSFKRFRVRRPNLNLVGNPLGADSESSPSDAIISPMVVEADVHPPPPRSPPPQQLNGKPWYSKDKTKQPKVGGSVTTSLDSLASSESPDCDWMIGDDFYAIKESAV